MTYDTALNDSPDVTSAGTAIQVKNPCGILTGFIVAEPTLKDNHRRAEALAAAYRYILSDAWGKP
jgi:hypothetical protein